VTPFMKSSEVMTIRDPDEEMLGKSGRKLPYSIG
jgi:hypothetical protein